MKIAILSDLHGNMPAVEQVLEDARRQQVDQVICAGDLVDPLRESLDVWHLLRERLIPVVRGNHEDYTIAYHQAEDKSRWHTGRLRPLGLVARHLGPGIAQDFAALPLGMTVAGPDGRDIFVCHASPESNTRSFYDGIDADMERQLLATPASVLVSGHRHVSWSRTWKDKLLVSVGSLGLPHHGEPRAEYTVLTFRDGYWTCDPRQLPYDHEATLRLYRESGWLAEGGPVAWLLYDEFCTGKKRLADLFKRFEKRKQWPEEESEWIQEVRSYFIEQGRWSAIQPLTA